MKLTENRKFLIIAFFLVGLIVFIFGFSKRGCRWGMLPQDCDSAEQFIALAHLLRHQEQIDPFFRQVGMKKPSHVKSVLDAKIEFAQLSYSEGCRWRTDLATFLGILLLEGGHTDEAISFLEIGNVDRPTRQGFLGLAQAYVRKGRLEDAEVFEKEADSKPQLFGTGPPIGPSETGASDSE